MLPDEKQSATRLRMSGPFTYPSNYNYTTYEKSVNFTNRFPKIGEKVRVLGQAINVDLCVKNVLNIVSYGFGCSQICINMKILPILQFSKNPAWASKRGFVFYGW